jgi:hypothetical protein
MFQGNRVNHTLSGTLNKILSLTHFFIFVLICCVPVQAQDPVLSNTLVSVTAKDMPLQNLLAIIEMQIPYRFAFNSELIARQKNISVDVRNMPLDELLLMILQGTHISYSMIGNQIVLQEGSRSPQVTINGYVKDSLTGESLPDAIIYLPERKAYTYANNYGFYSITQNKADSLDIVISYVGFRRIYKRVSAQSNSVMNFFLSEDKTQLNTVVITKSNPDDIVKKISPGRTDISMDIVKTVPSISGNGDILSTIQMMPGVMAGLDGRPGYFIRGGNTDQNLVQLDEATLYNPVHLLGLVGIFNSSAIKSAYLLKAGFPASFGDHLSSVLDVSMKDGNAQQFEGDLQIGTVTAGFTLSGPILSKKATFFVSARRSTIDLFLKPFSISNYYSDYNFYDINAKLTVQISQKDRIYLSFYQGRDNSSYTMDSTVKYRINYGVKYGNQAMVLRWNHLFSSKIFSNTSVIYDNYYHDVIARRKPYNAELYSGIRDMDFKTDFYFYPAVNHKISAGINYLYQTQFPASITDDAFATDSSIWITPSEIPKKFVSRIAFYFGDDYWLSPNYSLYLGARVPLFITRDVKYLHFEPRISLMRLINPSTSIKISYTQMHQFLNRVQSYNASFPAEIWIGCSKIVKPQNCQEASIGLFKNFRENMFQTSLELYYKHMGNQILFREGLDPAISSNLDSLLVFGQGQSYGAELYLGKTTGRLTGWLAYTLSYSNQRFDSLNLGNQFPFAGDRRHSLYLSVSYAINKHWQISSNFLFASGSAFTLFKDVARRPYNPLYYNNVTGNDPANGSPDNKVQNNYRLEPYNRLDLSISYTRSRNFPNRVVETEWVFSIYNVYARENTFFAYCSFDPVTRRPVPVQVSFVPIIPSISFNLKF